MTIVDVHLSDLQGNDYEPLLVELEEGAVDEQDTSEEAIPNLELRGILAVKVWLPLDTVVHLNQHEQVFLADASASHLRLIASNVDGVRESRSAVSEIESDGAATFIDTDVQDLYSEMIQHKQSAPTSVSLSNPSASNINLQSSIALLLLGTITLIFGTVTSYRKKNQHV